MFEEWVNYWGISIIVLELGLVGVGVIGWEW